MPAVNFDRKDGTHRCITCKEYLTADAFYKTTTAYSYRSRTYGLYSKCKECCRARARIDMKRNWPKYRYGIEHEDIKRMIDDKRGECALCGRVMKRPYIDHDHQTGVVRGILCCGCNSGLGQLGDTIEGLQRAMDYLVRHQERNAIIFDRSAS